MKSGVRDIKAIYITVKDEIRLLAWRMSGESSRYEGIAASGPGSSGAYLAEALNLLDRLSPSQARMLLELWILLITSMGALLSFDQVFAALLALFGVALSTSLSLGVLYLRGTESYMPYPESMMHTLHKRQVLKHCDPRAWLPSDLGGRLNENLLIFNPHLNRIQRLSDLMSWGHAEASLRILASPTPSEAKREAGALCTKMMDCLIQVMPFRFSCVRRALDEFALELILHVTPQFVSGIHPKRDITLQPFTVKFTDNGFSYTDVPLETFTEHNYPDWYPDPKVHGNWVFESATGSSSFEGSFFMRLCASNPALGGQVARVFKLYGVTPGENGRYILNSRNAMEHHVYYHQGDLDMLAAPFRFIAICLEIYTTWLESYDDVSSDPLRPIFQ